MKIITLTVGPVSTNSYILYDDLTLKGILIDPGDEAIRILAEIGGLGLDIVAVLVTHGHFDHIGAVDRTASALEVPVYGSKQDAALAADINLNRSGLMGRDPITCKITEFLTDEQVLDFGFVKIHALFTPGHTHGHMCYYLPTENILFTGDLLFKGTHGRYDMPTANYEHLKQSLFRLFEFPEHTKVYPGHGETTDIGYEKHHNMIFD